MMTPFLQVVDSHACVCVCVCVCMCVCVHITDVLLRHRLAHDPTPNQAFQFQDSDDMCTCVVLLVRSSISRSGSLLLRCLPLRARTAIIAAAAAAAVVAASAAAAAAADDDDATDVDDDGTTPTLLPHPNQTGV